MPRPLSLRGQGHRWWHRDLSRLFSWMSGSGGHRSHLQF